jgi:hypothetical protein
VEAAGKANPVDPIRWNATVFEALELRHRDSTGSGGFAGGNPPHQAGLANDVAGVVFKCHWCSFQRMPHDV